MNIYKYQFQWAKIDNKVTIATLAQSWLSEICSGTSSHLICQNKDLIL